MEYRVLGPLEVRVDGRSLPLGGRRQRLVLAALLLSANDVVSTDWLIDAVWGESPPQTARKSLQVYISRLRRILGREAIEAVDSGYTLRIAPAQLDSNCFGAMASEGRALLQSDPHVASRRLDEALDLWRGTPWGDLVDESVLRPDAERLRGLYLSILEDKFEADLSTGVRSGMVGQLESLVAAHPLRERLRGLLMLALYQDGRQGEALRVYQETRQYLAGELGIEPSPELQALEERILLQDETLSRVAPATKKGHAPSVLRNPYKGLRPFTEQDAGEFFGRSELTADIVSRVADARFVAVVGPSGCGKSSVVRAGLIPALRSGTLPGSESWIVCHMLPGTHPFVALESALLRADAEAPASLEEQMRGDDLDLLRASLRVTEGDNRLVLVIDQFEELFVLVDDADVRGRFVRNLIEAVEDPHSPLTVVVTLRGDFFDRPLEYPVLGELFAAGQINVLSISAAGLEEAIVKPASGVGVRVDPDLVAELIGDVVNERGALPLFEFVLTDMFERRRGDVLTLADYHHLGGLKGALSRRSEEVFASLAVADAATAEQVFLRLVTLGEGAEDTRRRVQRAELEGLEHGGGSIDGVLDRFGAVRLLTFDRDAEGNPTVEVAHEALLREWPRLRGWIEESRSSLRLQRQMQLSAQQWTAAGGDPDYLLTGSRLALYEEWVEASPVSLTALEVSYLQASLDHRDELIASELHRQERERTLERRSVSRLRVLVGVMTLALLLGGALAIWALDSRSEARDQTALAQQAADDLELGKQVVRIKELSAASVAIRQADHELALILALQAVDLADTINQPVLDDTVAALHWALQAGGISYPETDAPGVVLSGPQGLQGVIDLPLPVLIGHAQDHITRDLSASECATYFEGEMCPTLPPHFPAAIESEPLETAETDPSKPLSGTSVLVIGPYVFDEAVALDAEWAAFTEATGIQVAYDGTDDYIRSVVKRAEQGRRLDVILTPHPSFLIEASKLGEIVDISTYVDSDQLRRTQSPYTSAWVTLGEDGTWPADEGSLHGGMYRATVKSLVWYRPDQFKNAGYVVPETWEDLQSLSDRMVAEGRTPWCHGDDAGSASGWLGTDWIEDLVLHEWGPDVYDAWIRHDVTFDDERIRTSFERMDGVLLSAGRVLPNRRSIANISWLLAPDPMADNPPGCWMYKQASFGAMILPEDLGVAAFPFPSIDPAYGDAVLGAGDFVAASTDRPEVRALVQYMLSADFGSLAARLNPGFISPHRDFPMSAYVLCSDEVCEPDVRRQQFAEMVRTALDSDSFRFDASDLMHPDIGQGAFWSAMLDFSVAGPDNLDEILANIEAAWAEVESESATDDE